MITTLELIQILDAIERHGSFETAARELHKVRSALTYNIKKFEERLGIQIYDRSKHRAVLTETGRMLLEQGRKLVKLSNQLEEKVKQAATGWEPVLRVAYDEILTIDPLLDLLKNFQIKCPMTHLELYSEVLGGCTEALINNRVDIVIGISGFLPSRSEFMFELLGEIKFVFVVAPSHPLAKVEEPLTSETIKKFTAIVARDSARQTSLLSSMLLEDQRRITVSTLELKKQAQILGLGVGFLPYNHVKEDIKSGNLIIKRVERPQPACFCYIGWNKTTMGKAQTWFIDRLRNKNLQKKLLRTSS